jgi:hypothetical protein
MKFKVNMECVCELEDEDLKEEWGTLDPGEVAKKELPSIRYALRQPMFSKMKVAVKPILKDAE